MCFIRRFVADGKAKAPDEEQSSEQFESLVETLTSNGFEHYEISNFCKTGFHSRHNSSYWQGEAYLGVGPSAHSYNGESRQWNIANNALYIRSIESGEIPAEVEQLSVATRYNDYILTGLRTKWGCNTAQIKANFGDRICAHLEAEAAPYIEAGHLTLSGQTLCLTNSGKLLADRIASDLFYIED